MADIRRACAQRMHADSELVGLLATYGGAAAIFSEDEIPVDAPRPFVVVDHPSVDDPDDTKNTYGRERILSIRCFKASTDKQHDIDQIAERIRYLFHREPVHAPGERGWLASASGPTLAPTDNSLVGRLIAVRLRSSLGGSKV